MTTQNDLMVTETKELCEYPEFPQSEIPAKADCFGYYYMAMDQLCNIAESFGIYGKGRSFACNAFGGDKGRKPVHIDRQTREWKQGGKRIKKFVRILAVEKFFEEEGLLWK